ncbi:MAG: 6-phosphogluconolactonase [Verrucomicrobia bacterium]|jgi:6-phosphogluconolactonase|nr:6-phosphogluconolactonase [Verrucomicrobiota bacterium]
MANFELISFASDDELAQAVATAWLQPMASANRAAVTQCVALSGGRIAQKFFSSAARLAKARQVLPDGVHFFWADERCVPPNDVESHFRLAHGQLFAPLKISDDHIHRIRGEAPPDFAAREAEAEVCRLARPNREGQPVLDLIFLGMGEDGHVASLFPGEPDAVRSSKAVYRAVTAAKPPPQRITLGYAAIVAAREVWVLASGAGKAAVLRESLAPSGQTPLARVVQSRQRTRIFSDVC